MKENSSEYEIKEALRRFHCTAKSAFRRSSNFRRDPIFWDFLTKFRITFKQKEKR